MPSKAAKTKADLLGLPSFVDYKPLIFRSMYFFVDFFPYFPLRYALQYTFDHIFMLLIEYFTNFYPFTLSDTVA